MTELVATNDLRDSCLLPCMLLILSEGPAGAGAVGERLEGFGFRCDPHMVARRLLSAAAALTPAEAADITFDLKARAGATMVAA